MSRSTEAWQLSVERQLKSRIVTMSPLGGGDFAQAYKAELSTGQSVFIKTHQSPPANFFTTEATGLSWLRQTNSVAIPEVLAVSDDPPYLVLEWVELGGGKRDDEALGTALAQLHKHPFECFGRPDRRTTGSLAVPNEPTQQWVTFYATQRLLPLADIAQTRGALPSSSIDKLRTVADKLDKWELNEPVSLLHGDLWAGNRVVDMAGNSWLIDPAVHGGNREFDIAMMMLFGGYDKSCFAAYHEEYPLQADWQLRVSLHQLAPLTVHAIKFGGSYVTATAAALDKYT